MPNAKEAEAIIAAAMQDDSYGDAFKAAQDKKLKEYLLGAEQKIKNEAMQRDIDQANALRSQYGQDVGVKVGEVSLQPRDQFSSLLKGESASRMETKAIQDEANRLLDKTRDQAQAAAEVEAMLQNPSSVTEGALRPKIARLHGEVGALAEAEQKRAVPGSLKQDIKRGINYLTGRSEPGLSQAQTDALRKYLTEKKGQISKNIGAGQSELGRRAPYLAPTLQRQGRVPEIMGSVGAGAREVMGASEEQAPPNTPERLQQLRNKYKR